MNTPRNPVGWFEIYVQDLERAKTFYENTFQITLEPVEAPGIQMRAFPPLMQSTLPGSAGALVKREGKDSGSGGTLIYFDCEDCAVEAARAADHGGKIHLDKTSIGKWGFMAHVLDTEGNLIGLHSVR